MPIDPPINWVDTPEKSNSATFSNNKGGLNEKENYEWNSNFPIIVCAHEYIVEKSNPASIMRKKKKALIRIELRRHPKKGLGIQGYRDLETGSETSDWSEIIQSGDVVVFHLLKKRVTDEESGVSDAKSFSSHDSVSTIGLEAVEDFRTAPPKVQNGIIWQVKYSIPLGQVTLRRDKLKCVAELKLGKNKKNVLLHFSSEQESLSFFKFVESLKSTLRDIAINCILADHSDMPQSNVSSTIKFLVEIISATDLIAVNRLHSDPYVVVTFGGEKIHTTSVIYKNLDPIWTIGTKSLFIFQFDPADYYAYDLTFEVRDKETFVPGSTLGQAVLPLKQIVQSKGERIELRLLDSKTGNHTQGFLAVRCRQATQSDIAFVESIDGQKFITQTNIRDFATPRF